MLVQPIRSLLLGGMVAICLWSTGMPLAFAQQAGEIIPGRFIVTFKHGVPPGLTATHLSRSHGLRILHIYEHTFAGMAIEVGNERSARVLSRLRQDARVSSVGNDRYSSVVAEIYPKGLDRVDGAGASPGSPNDGAGVDVAVVDTGVDTDHADLAGRIDTIQSRSCLTTGGATSCRNLNPDNSFAFEDDHGHGTFVSGIIAADNNSEGIIGVAPSASIIAIKVCNAAGQCPDADITAGIDYLAGLYGSGEPAEVTNISLGGPCGGPCNETSDAMLQATHTAINGLVGLGTTVVVAAGNGDTDATNFTPAALDNVITVSAMADWDGAPGGNGGSKRIFGAGRVRDDTFAYFSNYGAPIDVIAPGVEETSLALGGGTAISSGTSFSSPHAAGVAAVFIRDYMDKHSGASPSPALVKQALIESGECHEGDGAVIHQGLGCTDVWPGDPDGIGESMVRVDNVVNFTPPVTNDVAITSIAVENVPVMEGETNTVTIGVTNHGSNQAEDISVSLNDDSGLVGTESGIALAAGTSTEVNISWAPFGPGEETLEARKNGVDQNPSNDSMTMTVDVQTPVHDVAVSSVNAPATVSQGDTATVSVAVRNQGTFDEANFEVTLTDVTTATPIGTQTVTDPLTPGTMTTLDFVWDTTGTSLGGHTLSGCHDFADEDTSDNCAQATSTVTEPSAGPDVTGISPPSMQAADSPVSVTIAGSGFGDDENAISVIFQSGSGPTPVAAVTSVTDTAIQADISVKVKGKKGSSQWDVVVTTPGGSAVLPDAFTVTR